MILLNITDLEIENYGHKLSDMTYDFNVDHDVDIKPIAKYDEYFRYWLKVYPFYANVEREGIIELRRFRIMIRYGKREEVFMRKRNRKQERKFYLGVLAAVMILAVWGIPVLAETACEKVNAAEAAERTGATREVPENPVHHCTKENDGSDYTDWSYVYFGSYPQTEVTGDDLTAAVTGASYDANGDAWVNGMKYRRISKSDTHNDSYFGNSAYRYFKWERIKWRVLRINSSTMFVMAEKGLDCKNYNEEDTSSTWENCMLRNWLNNDFYRMAFSSGEQRAVVPQTIINEDNPEYNTKGGNDTTDKVYLLSFSEAMNPDYGFCEKYSAYSVSRRVKASDYAHVRGAAVSTDTDYAGNCKWWLRSPGSTTALAVNVEYDGSVYNYGYLLGYYNDACVPALHINLSSDLWSVSDDGNSGDGGNGGTGNGNGGNSGSSSGLETTQAMPNATALKGKLKAGKKSITVQWKKQADVSGYQIQYSANKKFKKNGTKIKTVKKPAATKVTIKKLKAGKKYYVRVRTYKTVSGRNYYSSWSKTKNIKTKE